MIKIEESKKDILIAWTLFLVAFVVRFLLISKGPFYSDTVIMVNSAQDTLKDLSLHYMHTFGYPFTVVVAAVFIFLMRLVNINDPVFAVNFMSVFFGSFSIWIFYLFSRKFIDRIGSLFATFLLMFLPLHIAVSTFGMTHSVSIFFGLAGLYYLILYLEDYRINKIIISSILLGLSVAARPPDAPIILAAIFLYLIQSFKDSKTSKQVIFYRLLIFLVFFTGCILLFYLNMIFKVSLVEFKSSMAMYYLINDSIFLVHALILIVRILSIPGMIIALFSLLYCICKKDFHRRKIYFLLVWFVVLFISYGLRNIILYRYFLFALIPIFIMEGHLLSKLMVVKRLRVVLTVAVCAMVLSNFIKFYPTLELRHNYDLQGDFCKFINQVTKPDSLVIAMDNGTFIEYYSQRKVLYKPIGNNKADFDNFFKELDVLLKKNTPVYIIAVDLRSYDPKGYFRNILFHDYNLKLIGTRVNEEWHNTCIRQLLYIDGLYKIEKKA